MRLEKIRDFEDLKNFETRRDETRFSSRLAEKWVETMQFSSSKGLLMDQKDLIFANFGWL